MKGATSKQKASEALAARAAEEAAKAAKEAEKEAALLALADLANKYPYRWFPSGAVAEMCGFSGDAMTEFADLGAPIVAKKSNPHLLHAWLMQNVGKIGKIRGDKPSETSK